MTPEQIALIRQSFAKVASVQDQVAALFYHRLFALDPAIAPLFKGDFDQQRAKLMTALAAVVAALDRPVELLSAARDLGRRHAGYGVKPHHYQAVGSALLWTLAQGLGDGFSQPTREAWITAYGVLAQTMIAAGEPQSAEPRVV